jgi:hypothetical protein
MKKIGASSHIGDSGVALIHQTQTINRMGFVWHERSGTLDAGIDGEIELRDPSTGEVSIRASTPSALPVSGRPQTPDITGCPRQATSGGMKTHATQTS